MDLRMLVLMSTMAGNVIEVTSPAGHSTPANGSSGYTLRQGSCGIIVTTFVIMFHFGAPSLARFEKAQVPATYFVVLSAAPQQKLSRLRPQALRARVRRC